MDDENFRPRLGRMRGSPGKQDQTYLRKLLSATARAGGFKRKPRARFSGSRIGRGASVGRLLGANRYSAGERARRALVKTRLVRLGANGAKGIRAHLSYIKRDGVTREGEPGELYGAEKDVADGQEFVDRSADDRHQFRLIVSAEDGAQYEDLKPLVRRFMAQMEQDLGTRLEWVAVDHFNTAHPHSHIILRGRDDQGQNLVIAREYIAHGMRERVAELVGIDLGPRTDREIQLHRQRDLDAQRLTAIDRRLIRDRRIDGTVGSMQRDPAEQAMRTARLRKLGALGLAEELEAGRWRLSSDLAQSLRELGERGDIIRSLQRAYGAQQTHDLADTVIHTGVDAGDAPVVGRVLARGLSDELRDRHYLIVDGVDGRGHYFDIGDALGTEPLPDQAIVAIAARTPGVRDVDRTITAIASAFGGTYSADFHRAFDADASDAFIEAHVRRLEAMRRATAGVERQADGSWVIAPDHLDRVAAFEARLTLQRPFAVEVLSASPLQALTHADGATWLDREIASSHPVHLRDGGFGREVRQAQTSRQVWLVEQGLADHSATTIQYPRDLVAQLQRRELLRVASGMSGELGLPFTEPQNGSHVEGVIRRRVDLVSGRFALIENGREFSLVPWRRVLERQIGKEVSGIVREDRVNWTFGRQREGPMIS